MYFLFIGAVTRTSIFPFAKSLVACSSETKEKFPLSFVGVPGLSSKALSKGIFNTFNCLVFADSADATLAYFTL